MLSKNIGVVILCDLDKNWLSNPSMILKPLAGKSVFEILVSQLHPLNLSCVFSLSGSEQKLEEAENILRPWMKGSFSFCRAESLIESQRVARIVEEHAWDWVFRLSADNPVVGIEVMKKALEMKNSDAFFYSYGYPVGISVEFFSATILKKCLETGFQKRIREIVRFDLQHQIQEILLQPSDRSLLHPMVRWTLGTELEQRKLDFLFSCISVQELNDLSFVMKIWNEKGLQELRAPATLNIEPTNKCNLRCLMCPRDQMDRNLGMMDFSLFCKIVDEASEIGVENIYLHGYGEPFIHDQVFAMIRYIRETTKIRVRVNTNGLYLNENKIRQLLECPPHHLNISFDGATKQTYEKIRINGNFEKLVGIVHQFLEIREAEQKKEWVHLSLQLIRMEETEEEVDQFLMQWKGKVDEITIPPVHNWAGLFKNRKKRERMEILRFPCPELWRTMVVSWNGNVTICCAIINDDPFMGNLNQQTLYEIWRSEKYEQLRNAHLSNDFSHLSMCLACDLWKTMR